MTDRGTRRATDRARDWLERHALAIGKVATVILLVVMFYIPVGIVFAESILPSDRLSVDPFVEILTDLFYVGVLAELFRDPLALGDHANALAGWLLAGTPRPSVGLFGFTAYQAFLSTIASVALGLPGAYILSRFEFRGRRTLRSLTILPFVLPSIMVAIGFFAMFSENGPLNRLLVFFGAEPISILFTLEIIIIAHAFYNAPLVTRITTAAWEGIDARTVETARSLGASPRRAFFDVVFPQLLPAILTGAILSFIFTFMTFPIVLALGGLQLATVEVWVYNRIRNLAYTEAAALALMESVLSLGLLYGYLRYEARQVSASRQTRPPAREPLVPDLRSLFTPLRLGLVCYGLVVLVVFVGPLASMVAASLTGPGGLTLQHYEFLLERQATGASFQIRPLPAIRNSLVFGVGSLAIALPMGIAVALFSGHSRRRTVLDALAMLPLAVSGIVVGIGLLRGLVFGLSLPFGYRIQVTGTVAIVAAHAVAAYPFVTRTVAPMLAAVDRSMMESARALGASRYRTLRDIELPMIAPGVAAGAAFAFAISIGEFNSTVILAQGSDAYTMPVAVERYLGDQTLGPATAMGTVLLVITGLSFVFIDRLGGYRG